MAGSTVAMAMVISQNKLMFDQPAFKRRYGSLVKDLNTHGLVGPYWQVLSQVRWAATMIIMIFLRDFYALQMLSLLLISISFQALIILGRPFESALENAITLFNETMVAVYLYVLMILSDYFSKVNPYRQQCGWALVMILLLTICVNTMKFLVCLMWTQYRRVEACFKSKEPEVGGGQAKHYQRGARNRRRLDRLMSESTVPI